MSWKKSKNFVYGELVGLYTTTNTVFTLSSSHGAYFNTASTNSYYNVVLWNYSVSKDPSVDSGKEICSLTKKLSTNSVYLVRAQEGTIATSKTSSGSKYRIMYDFSKEEKDQIENYLYPVGSVIAYSNTSTPTNWLQCDGTAFNKTSTEYASLYSLIGTRFNTASTPSTKFLLPNFQMQVVMNINSSDTSSQYPKSAIGNRGGLPIQSLDIANLPVHGNGHVTSVTNGFVNFTPPGTPQGTKVTAVNTTSYGTGPPSVPHQNMSKYLIFQYLIKYK